MLVFNSELSRALAKFSFLQQAPGASFLIKAFCIPRSQPEFSLFLHEFGTLELYIPDLGFFCFAHFNIGPWGKHVLLTFCPPS